MGDVIPFPKPKIKLTQEESIEFRELRDLLDRAQTWKELRICQRKVEQFKKRVKKRHSRNPLP
ncbi:hypothetical protein GCM10011389_32200 [Pontibacillus salipaludis]|uniref:Uncharacterized protein n=1 Tax=Pontibacillus salipaludis TaxID=1697394 RepID=A0ABQ1QDG9_9BACI|nr:hypothetical protein GCM10011389_32200 [Pontibacillus salipaludis]